MADVAAPLLNTAEVAALLRVHPKHVYRLLRRGLPGRRLGGEWRFERDVVLAWVAREPRAEAEPAASPAPPPPLVAANGDVVVERLLARVNAEGGGCLGFVQADRATGLELLRRGRAIAAGTHAEVPPARLGGARLAQIHLVRREVGLCARDAAPALVDLGARRIAGRPPTAGIRVYLDVAVRAAGLDADAIARRIVPHASHRDVVCAVARGDADVGLATRAWAERVGLAFRTLATESYGLVLRAVDLGHPEIVRLCEIAQGAAFRRELAAVPGYDATGCGDIRYGNDT